MWSSGVFPNNFPERHPLGSVSFVVVRPRRLSQSVMFDGLDLKAPEETPPPATDAAPMSSAFSFLNSSMETPAEAPAPNMIPAPNMMEGLTIKEATPSPVLDPAPVVPPMSNMPPKVVEETPAAEDKSPISNFMDMQAAPQKQDLFANLETTQQPMTKKPIVKKRRPLKRVGYQREDPAETDEKEEEQPAVEEPAPQTVIVEAPQKDPPKKAGVLARMFGPKRKTESPPAQPTMTPSSSIDSNTSPQQHKMQQQQQKQQQQQQQQQQKQPPQQENNDGAGGGLFASMNIQAPAAAQKQQAPPAAKEKTGFSFMQQKSEPQKQQQQQQQQQQKPVMVQKKEAEPMPEPEPEEKAPEVELEEKIQSFVSQTTELCFRLSEHDRRAAEVGKEREALVADQATFEIDLKAKVKEQERLAEAEEYERADELTTAVERLKQEMALRAAALRDLALEVDRAEREIAQKRKERKRAVEDLVTWLVSFEAGQRDAVFVLSTEAKQRREAAARRVAAETERLSMERAHVERDAAHVAEEFERMEKLIDAQTSGDATRRDKLLKDKAKKDADIDELRTRLASAIADRDAVDAELQAAEATIATARSKFERQLQRLEQRDAMVKASMADCDTELKTLDDEKVSIDKASLDAEAQTKHRRDLADSAKVELTVAEQLVNSPRIWEGSSLLFLDQHKKNGSSPLKASSSDEEELAAELRGLQESVAEAEETSHEARAKLLALERQRDVLAKDRRRVEDRLPQLEIAKKAAAASRNYKEAGNLAKEAKNLATERDSIDAKLLELAAPLDAAISVAEEKAQVHKAAKAKLAEQQREALVRQLRVLRRKARDLKKAQRAFAKQQHTSKVASAASDLAKVELSNLTTKADDLVKEENLQDYDEPPVASSDDEEEEDGKKTEAAPQEETMTIEEQAEATAATVDEVIGDMGTDFAQETTEALPEDKQEEATVVEDAAAPIIEAPAEETEVAAPAPEEEEDAPPPVAAPEKEEAPVEPEADTPEVVAAKRADLETKIADMEKTIDAAVEQDDFDTAENLATELDALKTQLEALPSP